MEIISIARVQFLEGFGQMTKKPKANSPCSMVTYSKVNSETISGIMACTGTKMGTRTKAHGRTISSRASVN